MFALFVMQGHTHAAVRHGSPRRLAPTRPESVSSRNTWSRPIPRPYGDRGARRRGVGAGPGQPLPLSAPRASAAARRDFGTGTGTGTAPCLGHDRQAVRAHRPGRPQRHRRRRTVRAAGGTLSAPRDGPGSARTRRRQGRTRPALRGTRASHTPRRSPPPVPPRRRTKPQRSVCPRSRSGAAPGFCRRTCAAPRLYGLPTTRTNCPSAPRVRAANSCCSACCPGGAAPTGSSTGTPPDAVASSPAAPAARSDRGRRVRA